MSHFPGHLRDAFVTWVDAGAKLDEPVVVERNYEPVEEDARTFLLGFRNCTDIMDQYTCESLGVERGSTYADGVAVRLAQDDEEQLLAERFSGDHETPKEAAEIALGVVRTDEVSA